MINDPLKSRLRNFDRNKLASFPETDIDFFPSSTVPHTFWHIFEIILGSRITEAFVKQRKMRTILAATVVKNLRLLSKETSANNGLTFRCYFFFFFEKRRRKKSVCCAAQSAQTTMFSFMNMKIRVGWFFFCYLFLFFPSAVGVVSNWSTICIICRVCLRTRSFTLPIMVIG